MRVDRVIDVGQAGPLAALQGLLHGVWERNGLTAMLAPVESDGGREISPQAIHDSASVATINPFAPTMPANVAALVVGFAREHQPGSLAVVMRPCEWRALVELRKRRRTTPEADRVITISVDCLGTLPAGRWADRASASSPAELWREALRFADQGGFTPQAMRRGCQLCTAPSAQDADLTIGLFGLDTASSIIVSSPDEVVDARLHMGGVAPRLAPEDMIVRREVAVGALTERRRRHRVALLQDLQQRGGGLAALLGVFANCSQCGDCLDACPLYNGELAGVLGVRSARHGGRSLLGELVELARWMASCSECGMCEEVCSRQVPLLDIVSPLSQRVREEMAYHPGDPGQALPWLAS